MLPSRLLVVHDPSRCGENDIPELTRWQELDDPLLEICEDDVVSWGDDPGLIEAAIQLDDDLAVAVVVDFLKLANVA